MCVCPRVCVICVYACSCRRVATAALPLLSLISNQLSRLKPKVIYGHRRFLLSLFIILFFPSVPSSSPAILTRHFMPCLSPRSFSPLRPLYFRHFPQPKPCPPLTLCLLSVNSFFLLPVCWPRLTYFSLSLFQLSLSLPLAPSRSLTPSLFLSPSVSLVPFHLPSALSGKTQNRLHMCTHKHT